MRLRDDKRRFQNPFVREAKLIGVLILILGLILLVTIFFGRVAL